MAKWACLVLALIAAASAAPNSRIVGGTETTIEEFPYIVALVYTYPGAGVTVQRCVGCLISSYHVLSSGFCFTGANIDNMVVRAGSTDSLVGGTVVGVNDVIKHPDYVETPRRGDIAVMITNTPIGLTNLIDILYLPTQNSYIPDGQQVKVVSWGFEYIGGPQLERLKTVFLNKLSLESCQAAYSGNGQAEIADPVICASAQDRGMCTGDSGAPMVIDRVIVGISSYFEDCDQTLPDVFSRIDRYTNWVLDVAVGPSSDVPAEGIRARPVQRAVY